MGAAVTDELQRELRTREADGDGTDVRLVLLEAAMVAGRLDVLDERLKRFAGIGGAYSRDDRRGLQLALRPPDDPLFAGLAEAWCGFDLQEVTMELRHIDDLIDLLLHGMNS